MMQPLRSSLFAFTLLTAITSALGAAESPWAAGTWRAISPPSSAPTSSGGRVVGVPAALPTEKAAAPALPTFSRYMTVGRAKYKFTMVGRDLFAARAKNVTVPVKLIPVAFIFPDGSVFDPTAPGPDCAGGGVPVDLTIQSPVFSNYDYGDGPRQFYEFVRRIEFWPYTGGGRVNPGYSVRLAPTVLPTLTIQLPPGYPTTSAHCGRLGAVDMASLKAYLATQVFPQFARAGITPSSFAVFLFSNVVVIDGDSIDLGFHSAFSSSKGIQTFGVAEYDSSKSDNTIQDISVLSHEVAEWYDDPFVNNYTPPWGHIGQVADCYPFLEVGDPLSGQPLFEFAMPNGILYHPQETAYFSWFFRQPQSYGANGFYSSGGTFTTPADPCQ